MKKLVVLLLSALALAAVIWVAVRIEQARRQSTVAELLPKTTLALAHVPDFNRTRRQWHESDVYQIWREPSVQAWLQKPLAKLPHNRGRQTLEDFLSLGPTHGFVALTSIENNEPKLVGGFHFEQTPEATRHFIEQREAEWLPKSSGAKRETVVYEEHKIETLSVSRFSIASAYAKNWFFASNDLATLEALLDRADHRTQKMAASLQENEAFRSATKHLPADFAGMFFFQAQPFVEKFMPLLAMTGQSLSTEQLQRLKQVQSVAGAFGFDHGKMREAEFMTMPRQEPSQKITRASLALASTNTFLYSASLMRWPEQWNLPTAPAGGGLLAMMKNVADALASRGISQDDLRAAFGNELEIIGAWSPETRWPTVVATLPVKDGARARKIADALSSIEVAGEPWTRSEKNGATYYSAQPFGGFIPLSPAVAISAESLIAGSDSAAINAALAKTPPPPGELRKSATFRESSARLPTAESAFNYLDARLLFERVDAALRPLLLMSATFYPALGQKIDTSKFPPAEAIAKHLSPIVMSQRYASDGYLSESIGPVTFNQATIGLAAAVGGALIYFQDALRTGRFSGVTPTVLPAPSATPPRPTPTPTPS